MAALKSLWLSPSWTTAAVFSFDPTVKMDSNCDPVSLQKKMYQNVHRNFPTFLQDHHGLSIHVLSLFQDNHISPVWLIAQFHVPLACVYVCTCYT